MFEALTAPEPMSIVELLLVTTRSAAAVRVVVVVLLIAPLVNNSMFPDVVCRFSVIIIGEVFVEDPTVMALGLLVKASCEANSNEVLELSFNSVVL